MCGRSVHWKLADIAAPVILDGFVSLPDRSLPRSLCPCHMLLHGASMGPSTALGYQTPKGIAPEFVDGSKPK